MRARAVSGYSFELVVYCRGTDVGIGMASPAADSLPEAIVTLSQGPSDIFLGSVLDDLVIGASTAGCGVCIGVPLLGAPGTTYPTIYANCNGTTLHGNAGIMVVDGMSGLSNGLTVFGRSTTNISNPIFASSNVMVSGPVGLSNGIAIYGRSTTNISNPVYMSSNCTHTGPTYMSNTLAVSGWATLSNVAQSGQATFSNASAGLGVGGALNVGGVLTASNAANVGGALNIGGNISTSGGIVVGGTTAISSTRALTVTSIAGGHHRQRGDDLVDHGGFGQRGQVGERQREHAPAHVRGDGEPCMRSVAYKFGGCAQPIALRSEFDDILRISVDIWERIRIPWGSGQRSSVHRYSGRHNIEREPLLVRHVLFLERERLGAAGGAAGDAGESGHQWHQWRAGASGGERRSRASGRYGSHGAAGQ